MREKGSSKQYIGRRAKLIGHIKNNRSVAYSFQESHTGQLDFWRNCLFHATIKGQMEEVKGVGRRRRQLFEH
jgi:hypothetical protein